MGLSDLIDDDTDAEAQKFRRYGAHEYNDTLEEWVDEFQERFPVEVQVDFIEVSPELSKNAIKTYWKIKNSEVHQYIRVAESVLDQPDHRIRHFVLQAMVQLYCNEQGFQDLSKGTNAYKWVCGAVHANGDLVSEDSQEFSELILPFLEESLAPDEEPEPPIE